MKPQLLFLALLSFCAGAHADEPKKSHILDGPAFQSGERRNLIWEDTFESGSWNARKHSGSSAGSLDQAPTWEQSMNQGDYSAKVVDGCGKAAGGAGGGSSRRPRRV